MKKEKSESKGSRTYRIATRLSDGVGEQGTGGAKREKIGEKNGEKHPKWDVKKKEKKKREEKVDKVATCTREDRLGPFRQRKFCLAREEEINTESTEYNHAILQTIEEITRYLILDP